MTTMREILDVSEVWVTTQEIERRLGLPPGRRSHIKIRSMCRHYAETGRMETRWSEGGGREYRASPSPRDSKASAPVERRVLAVLEGEMTTGEIAERSGRSTASAYSALVRLSRRGIVEAVASRPTSVWRRADGGGTAEETLCKGYTTVSEEAEECERDWRNEP